jgi:hypothetical protein
MADYAITAANVLRSANSTLEHGIAGATIARTAPLIYQDPGDNTWKPAKADAATPGWKAIAWALQDVSTGQDVSFIRLDPNFKPGFAIAVQEIAVLSWTTSGKLAPYVDIAGLPSGGYLTIALVGIGGNFATLCLVNVYAPKP